LEMRFMAKCSGHSRLPETFLCHLEIEMAVPMMDSAHPHVSIGFPQQWTKNNILTITFLVHTTTSTGLGRFKGALWASRSASLFKLMNKQPRHPRWENHFERWDLISRSLFGSSRFELWSMRWERIRTSKRFGTRRCCSKSRRNRQQ
jgi:hypothetical protein